MALTFDEAQTAVRGASCFIADSVVNGTAFVNDLTLQVYRDLGGTISPQQFWQARIADARDLICNDGPVGGAALPSAGGSQVPFTGGQCLTDYRVRGTWDRFFNGTFAGTDTQQLFQGILPGPVVNVFERANDGMPSAENDVGTTITAFSGSPAALSYANLRDVSVERVDGQADDCGDAGGGSPEEPMWRYPIPNPDDPNLPDIDIDVGFPIVIIGPGGEVSFNFGVNIGALALSFTYAPGAGDPKAEEPTDPYDCCPEVDTNGEEAPETPDDPDDPPSPLRFSAVICSVTTTPIRPGTATEKGNGNGPSIYLPSLAEIRFAVETPRGNTWSQAVKIQGLSELIEVPTRFPAFDWNVDEYQGVPITVTPLYNREEPSLEEDS